MKEDMIRGDIPTDCTSKKQKRTLGRQKIKMKPIKQEAARQVCFSKRRSGLFKKASELSILCGAHIAVVVFSPAKKPFSFIHPSALSVLDRYLFSQSSQPHHISQNQLLSQASTSGTAVSDLSSQLAQLTAVLKTAKNRKEVLKKRLQTLTLEGNVCVDGDMLPLGWTELDNIKMQLERVKANILIRAEELFMNNGWFMDGTGCAEQCRTWMPFACDEGGMFLPASLASVSDHAVQPIPTCPSNQFWD